MKLRNPICRSGCADTIIVQLTQPNVEQARAIRELEAPREPSEVPQEPQNQAQEPPPGGVEEGRGEPEKKSW